MLSSAGVMDSVFGALSCGDPNSPMDEESQYASNQMMMNVMGMSQGVTGSIGSTSLPNSKPAYVPGKSVQSSGATMTPGKLG